MRRLRGRVAIVLGVIALRVLLGEGGFAPLQAGVVSSATEWPFADRVHGSEDDHGHEGGEQLATLTATNGVATLLRLGDDEVLRPTTTTTTAARQVLVIPTSPDQWFAPSGRNGGTEGIGNALATLALTDNKPLYVSDVWGRTSGSASSDHHVTQLNSWAVDLAVRGIQQPTPATEEAARRIGSALGEPGWTGGNMTKTINGYRIQVLWKVAGHFNHVHVGIRKL